MTGEEKVKHIEGQIRACELGATNAIECPYCGVIQGPSDQCCCMPFAVAVMAILDRKEVDDRVAIADRIADKCQKN